ncbi:M20/M25/M40 family metallo-hydrolase [Mycolicibacterium septicum]|uniref:M20/M25/M40 family metallo-hydrolase n=1 Tax=Mycolicibacterium septicum TaxID=98668 RepID=UPI001AF22D38|nr:M20/M25/M40 family metallo-hydrolase [Mycolicibacterium septicum]QRY54419.1 M20/M25/M40 family metallo-hydrolase [Mycolicibacterium septicum]
MKLVLFDLGQTLEDGDVLLPGAFEALTDIAELRDGDGNPVLLGLASDFDEPAQQYYDILETLGIRSFFEPVDTHITLSGEVGVHKPAREFFAKAVAKANPALAFADVLFITENPAHVAAARTLGLDAIQVRAPGGGGGDIGSLSELLPRVQEFAGGDWVRLGDTVLRRDATHTAARAHQAQLRLVVQHGRLYQKAHPDVAVLSDKGRYLVVDVGPDPSNDVTDDDFPCYSVRDVPWGSAVFETRQRIAREPEPAVQKCVDAVSAEQYELDLRKLVGFGTRHSTSAQFGQAADWAQSELEIAGYRTRTQIIDVGGRTSRNVIAERDGSAPAPRDVVLVTAHLDSINLAGGPAAPAPGADDNGSGSAGVLTIARAVQHHSGRHDVRFILFGGEEEGLFGSLAYVASLSATERSRIRAVVNMDMIATLNTADPTVLLEGAAVSQQVIDGLADAAHTYTGLTVQTSLNPFNSDHVPFIDQGIAAVLTIEGADGANDHVHSAADTMEFIDIHLAVEILRMNVAFVTAALG